MKFVVSTDVTRGILQTPKTTLCKMSPRVPSRSPAQERAVRTLVYSFTVENALLLEESLSGRKGVGAYARGLKPPGG